ncbi:hypothetical protein [Streptomyces sp. KS 21]|uniref:hypothetical protein n=1 Tax=Streptomyces sp. KS 21 TaxID=2485150 RepID=UPI0014150A36|nr:hypothetical protein [Streptomyces sp. KS 21]
MRGNPAYETHLRFNLSAAPAGQALKAAAPQVKTSTQTGVGTADTVSPVWSPGPGAARARHSPPSPP